MREYIPVSIQVVSQNLINVVFLHEGKEVISPFEAKPIKRGEDFVYGCDDRFFQYYVRYDELLRNFEEAVGDVFDANKRVDAASGKHKILKITSVKDDKGINSFLIEFENYESSIKCRIDDSGELNIIGEGVLPGSFADGQTKMLLARFLNDFHNAVK